MPEEPNEEAIQSVAKSISVHPNSIHAWIKGKRLPRPSKFEKMHDLLSQSVETEEIRASLKELKSSWDITCKSDTEEARTAFGSTLLKLLSVDRKPPTKEIKEEGEAKKITRTQGRISLVRAIPSWAMLRSLGGNRTLKSSYIWFFITPVAANLMAEFPNPIHLSFGGTAFSLQLSLPFSWQAFFWAAATFSAANALYYWFCPWIIRDFTSYSDYEVNKGYARIREWSDLHDRARKSTLDDWGGRFMPVDRRLQLGRTTNFDAEAMEYYDRCYEEGTSLTTIRIIVSAGYLIGLILLGLVLGQNIMFVIRAL